MFNAQQSLLIFGGIQVGRISLEVPALVVLSSSTHFDGGDRQSQGAALAPPKPPRSMRYLKPVCH
jgi:hypothetical protein